jgi:hypothetical protein
MCSSARVVLAVLDPDKGLAELVGDWAIDPASKVRLLLGGF